MASAAPVLFGSHDVCVFGNLRIWAERGLIHIEDSRDNSYDSFSVRTQLHRLNAISDMLKNSRAQMARTGAMPTDEFDRHMRMLEKMEEVCRKAQIQGMPTDASARRDLVRRRPVSVSVPTMKMAM